MSKRSSQSPRAKAHTLAASPSSKKMKNRTSSKLLHDDESFLNSNLAAAYLNNKNTKNAPANNQNEHLMLMSDLDLEDSMTLMSPIRPASRSVTIGNIAEGSYFKVPNGHDSNHALLQMQLAKAMDEMSHLRYSWNSEMETRSLLEQKNRDLTHELELARENCTQMKSELENYQTLSSRLLLKHDNQEERLQQAQAKANNLEKQLAEAEKTVAQLKNINEQYANSHSEKAKQLWLEKEKMLVESINDLKDKNSLARKEISRLQEDNENISYQLETKKKRITFLEEEQAKLTAQQSETLMMLASLEKSIKENNMNNKNTDDSSSSPNSPGKDSLRPIDSAANAANVVLETKVLSLESEKKFLEDRLTLLEKQLLEQQKQQFEQQQQQQQQLQQQFQLHLQSLQEQQKQHQEILLAAVSRPVSAPSYPRNPVSGVGKEGSSPTATANSNWILNNNPFVSETSPTEPPVEDLEAKPSTSNTSRPNAINPADIPNNGKSPINDRDANGRSIGNLQPRAYSFNGGNPQEASYTGPNQLLKMPPLNVHRSANNINTNSSNYSPNNNMRYNNVNATSNNRFPENSNNMYAGNRPDIRNTPPNNWINAPQGSNPNIRNMGTNGQQIRPQSSPSRANPRTNSANNVPHSPARHNPTPSPSNRSATQNSLNLRNNVNSNADFSFENMHNPSSPSSMSNWNNAPWENRANSGEENKQFVPEPNHRANSIVNNIYPVEEVDHENLSQHTSAVLPPADIDGDEGVPNDYNPTEYPADYAPYDSAPAEGYEHNYDNHNGFDQGYDNETDQYYGNNANNDYGDDGYYEQQSPNENVTDGYDERNQFTNNRNMNSYRNGAPMNERNINAQPNHKQAPLVNNGNKSSNNYNVNVTNSPNNKAMNRPNNGPVQQQYQRPQQNNYINTHNNANVDNTNNNNNMNNNNYPNRANANMNTNTNAANRSAKNNNFNNLNNSNNNLTNNYNKNNSVNSANMPNRNNIEHVNNAINNVRSSNSNMNTNNLATNNNINNNNSSNNTPKNNSNPIDNTTNTQPNNNNNNANNNGTGLTRSRGTTAEEIDFSSVTSANKPTNQNSSNNINPKPSATANPPSINDTNNVSSSDNGGIRIVRRESTRANPPSNPNNANVNSQTGRNTAETATANANSSVSTKNQPTGSSNEGNGVETSLASSKSSRPLTQNSLRRLSSRYMKPGETTDSSKNRLLQEKMALKKQIMDFMKQFVKNNNRQPTKEEREAGAGKLAKEYRTISKVIEEIEKGTITSDMNSP